MTYASENLNVLIGVFLAISVGGLFGFVASDTKAVWLRWFNDDGFFSSDQFFWLLIFIAFILSTRPY